MMELIKALSAFQGSMQSIAHNREGQLGNRRYTYADLATILDAIREPMKANGLALTQQLDASSITTTVWHISGEHLSSCMPLQAAGKVPQELGCLITYLRRYSISALLGLATEADDDAAELNGKAQRLAQTFSMGGGGPVGLKQQLVASISHEKGVGISKCRSRMRELNTALEQCSDLDELAGIERGFGADLQECKRILEPEWYDRISAKLERLRRTLENVQ